MSRLLDELRKKFNSPEEALSALGLDADVLPPEARFTLAEDCQTVTHKASGRVFDKVTVMKILFGKESPTMSHSRVARLAGDQSTTKQLPSQMRTPQDQDDPNISLAPRGASNGSAGVPPDADDLIALIRLCMSKLSGPDLDQFSMQLADLLSSTSGGPGGVNGVPPNNAGATTTAATDRRRAGARDNRKPAQDGHVRAINHSGFLKRFPDVAKVEVWGRR